MNGLGLGNHRPFHSIILDGLTTAKCVKVGTVSGTCSDYTVQGISCLTFWLSRTTHLERDEYIDFKFGISYICGMSRSIDL